MPTSLGLKAWGLGFREQGAYRLIGLLAAARFGTKQAGTPGILHKSKLDEKLRQIAILKQGIVLGLSS